MWINNIDPVLFEFWIFQIRYYGLVFVLGALLTYFFLERSRKSGKLPITAKNTADLVTWLIIGTVVGARIFYFAFYNLGALIKNPLELFYIWHGGLSFHGGLVGIVIVAYIFCRKKQIDILALADTLIIPIIFALALGRIANFTNSELLGTPSSLPWCIIFPNAQQADELCRHPYMLYEALKRFIIFGWLLLLSKKFNSNNNSTTLTTTSTGFIFWNFVFLEGFGRFFLDFFKQELLDMPNTVIFGLGTGQWLSIFMVIVAVYFLNKNHRKDIKSLYPQMNLTKNESS